MTGSAIAVIVIPVVGFVAVGIMIGLVLLASRRPAKDRGLRPRRNVAGGAFRGDPRQVTPHRDAEPPEAAGYRGGGRDERNG